MILAISKIFLAYLLVWFIGYLIISLIDKDKRFCLGCKFFVAFLLGIGFFTLQAFVIGIMGLSLNLITFLIIIVADLIILEGLIFIQQKKLILPKFRLPNFSAWLVNYNNLEKVLLILLILIILVKASASFWQVTHSPVYEFDAWNNWNLRAKVIFTEQKIPLDKSYPFYLGGGIKSYPLNDGLWKVWLATVLGEWNEQLINTYSLFFYLILLGLFYFSLPKNFTLLIKIVATYLLASLPFLYFHSWVAYADLTFAVYLFLAISSLVVWLKNKQRNLLYLSAIALALVIWTKNEGFAVVLPVILGFSLALFLAKKWQFKSLFSYWLTLVLVVSPWLIFRFTNRLELLSGDSSTFNLVFNSQFLGDWFSSVFLRSHFNFLWLLVFLLLIFKAKVVWQNLVLRYLSLILILLFLFYNGIIIFTDRAYDLGALARVNLQIAPIALFLVILILKQIFCQESWFSKQYDQTE